MGQKNSKKESTSFSQFLNHVVQQKKNNYYNDDNCYLSSCYNKKNVQIYKSRWKKFLRQNLDILSKEQLWAISLKENIKQLISKQIEERCVLEVKWALYFFKLNINENTQTFQTEGSMRQSFNENAKKYKTSVITDDAESFDHQLQIKSYSLYNSIDNSISKDGYTIDNENSMSCMEIMNNLAICPNSNVDYSNNTLIEPEPYIKENASQHYQNSYQFDEKLKNDQIHQENILKFKAITKFIENHILNNESNPLFQIRKTFLKYFITQQSEINQRLNYLYKNDPSLYNQESLQSIKIRNDDLKQQINKFLIFFRESICSYYRISELEKENNFINNGKCCNGGCQNLISNHRLQHFVLNILFSSEDVYDIVFDAFRLSEFKKENQLKEAFQQQIYDKLLPQNFGVQKKFCLIQKQNSSPYQKSIDFFKNLQTLKSPYHKLKLILQLRHEIISEIQNYYADFKNQVFELQSHDYLGILNYIIAKSNIYNLPTYCSIIESFVDDANSYYDSGYSFFTFRSCVDYFK